MDDLRENLRGGAALVLDQADLAVAGIDQQPHGQRQIRLPREMADRLRLAFFEENEIILLEVARPGRRFCRGHEQSTLTRSTSTRIESGS